MTQLSDAFLLEGYLAKAPDNSPVEVWIAQRSDGLAGSGTPNDPYHAGTAAHFDALMSGLGDYTRVNLGPDVYETTGYSDQATPGWQARLGMKIVGAGIDVTTLKLVKPGAAITGMHYAVGHRLATQQPASDGIQADFFEISDLTIDANLSEPNIGTNIARGALRIKGNHARIRRVKVINWGSLATGPRCFVISLITVDPNANYPVITDPGMEDCIVVDPYAAAAGATLLQAGLQEDVWQSVTILNEVKYGEAPWIRNCFLDCGSMNTLDIIGISMGYCLGGLVEGNQVHNLLHGGPAPKTTTTYEVIVRNNFYKNVRKGVFGNVENTSHFDLQKLIVEGNTIELVEDESAAPAIAIDLFDSDPQTPQYFYGQVIVRNNKIRFLNEDGDINPNATGLGIRICGAEAAIVENNIVELADSEPLKNYRCGEVKYFNNTTPAGILIQGVNATANKKYDEVETDAEFASVLACFTRR